MTLNVELATATAAVFDAVRHVNEDDPRHHHLVEAAVHFNHAEAAAARANAAAARANAAPAAAVELPRLRADVVDAWARYWHPDTEYNAADGELADAITALVAALNTVTT